jgi:signal transduction histidine kinase
LIQSSTTPNIHLTVNAPPLQLDVERLMSVSMIVAEAVTNAVRHAGARQVEVQVGVPGPCVVVEVCDDGLGTASPREEGVGLVSMRERAAEIGGSLVLVSSPGHGTRVRAELPVQAGPPR